MTSEPRTVPIDAELVRGMVFDATVYVVTRPLAIIAYVALCAALVINAVLLPMILQTDPDRGGMASFTLIALAALIVASILFTRASVRRAISTAMPAGTNVRVSAGAERIEIVSKSGTSDVRYDTFRSVHIGRNAALLRLRGTNVITAIPRASLSDDDIARLRSAIG